MILRRGTRELQHGQDYFLLSYHQLDDSSAIKDWLRILTGIGFVLFFSILPGPFLGIKGLLMTGMLWITYSLLVVASDELEIWFKGDRLTLLYKPLPYWSRNNNVKRSVIDCMVVHQENSRYGPRYDVALKLKNGKVKTFAVASDENEAKVIVNEINVALRMERRND